MTELTRLRLAVKSKNIIIRRLLEVMVCPEYMPTRAGADGKFRPGCNDDCPIDADLCVTRKHRRLILAAKREVER